MAPQFALLGSLCVLLNTLADLLAIALSARLAARIRKSPRAIQRLHYLSGTVLLGLGSYLVAAD